MNSSRFKKRSQAATAGALILSIMLMMSACGDNKPLPGNASNISSPQNEQNSQGNGIVDPGSANQDDEQNQSGDQSSGEENQNNEDAQNELHTAKGQYVGLQDSNQIEIVTENGAEAFVLTDPVRPIIETLEPDAEVEIEYTVKVIDEATGLKQLWLQSIKEVK